MVQKRKLLEFKSVSAATPVNYACQNLIFSQSTYAWCIFSLMSFSVHTLDTLTPQCRTHYLWSLLKLTCACICLPHTDENFPEINRKHEFLLVLCCYAFMMHVTVMVQCWLSKIKLNCLYAFHSFHTCWWQQERTFDSSETTKGSRLCPKATLPSSWTKKGGVLWGVLLQKSVQLV